MFRILLKISLLCQLAVLSMNSLALTPTFNVVQEIDFGRLTLGTGSCRMSPIDGSIVSFQGPFLCSLSGDVQPAKYVIVANPNHRLQVKVIPSLDNGDGFMFNPRVNMTNDVTSILIVDNTEFVEIDTGTSGIVHLDMGGDLTVYGSISSGQTFNFTYEAAIEWSEL
ncbi:MAG: hypothetical protein ABJK37_23640 [Paraglaciecola sp.]|uniref:hypothetical protein n=1 Tax=Paraglaciecola sp. TaxID=1920173 RepID=UPI0032978D7A